jgi:hypothetical protein
MSAENPPTETDDGAHGTFALLRRNPVIVALYAVCIVAGATAGILYLPEDFSLIRKLAGGALGGGGIAFLMTLTKML